MRISPLSDHMHFFNEVVDMKFQAFSYLTGEETIEDYRNRQKDYVRDILLPRAYIVLNDSQELIGTFALKKKDFKHRLDLTPWLGSVVVSIKHRRQGVGRFIVSEGERLAREMGYKALYLYTPDQEAWYSKQGWDLLERSKPTKFTFSVMSKKITLP